MLHGVCEDNSRNTHGICDLATLMVFMKISCPARFDTENSRTFSPELEVAEGAGSSPEARNFGQPVLLHASPFARVSSAGSICRSGSRLERAPLSELIFHGHHFRRRQEEP